MNDEQKQIKFLQGHICELQRILLSRLDIIIFGVRAKYSVDPLKHELYTDVVDILTRGPGFELFQQRVKPWLVKCFGEKIATDKIERNHRFLEESLELVQSTGCTKSEVLQLVDYVFSRDIGEPAQEVGGVMVTLAALCLANELDMHNDGETELNRIWGCVEKIREKQANKPKHSPLPE